MSDTDETGTPALPPGVARALGRPEVWQATPDGLEEDVLAALRRARDGAGDRAGDRVAGADELARRRNRRAPGVAWLAAAAATAVVAAGGTWALVARDTGPDAVVALAGTPLAPEASGRAEITGTPSGFAIDLDVASLAPAAPGAYYQAWLKAADDRLVTVGTFHAREGGEDIVLWSGVDPADYPTLTVTLQREGDGPASSGQVVLRGPVR